MAKPCISCGSNVEPLQGSVSFSCPGCTEVQIVRCPKCRKAGKKFQCPNCSFEGP